MLPASSTCRKCTDGYLTTRQHSCAECGDMLYLLKASGILIFESIQQHSDFCSKVPRLAAARLAAERALRHLSATVGLNPGAAKAI